MKKYISIMNNVTKTSIVAILVCVKCIKSNVNNSVIIVEIHVFLVIFFPRRYITGTIITPNKVPINLQPNGHIPNISIPIAMIAFPSGGCVIS